jgi:hypothetical protein
MGEFSIRGLCKGWSKQRERGRSAKRTHHQFAAVERDDWSLWYAKGLHGD